MQALASNVSAFNQIFLEKEENAMMWLHQLEEACDANPGREESSSLYQSLAEFHAETLMVMHWSITAYTCAVKILKKHQKHTGLLIKHDDLLSQPFCSTEVTCLLNWEWALSQTRWPGADSL